MVRQARFFLSRAALYILLRTHPSCGFWLDLASLLERYIVAPSRCGSLLPAHSRIFASRSVTETRLAADTSRAPVLRTVLVASRELIMLLVVFFRINEPLECFFSGLRNVRESERDPYPAGSTARF